MSLSHTPLVGMLVGIVAGLGSALCLLANRVIEFGTNESQAAYFSSARTPSIPHKPTRDSQIDSPTDSTAEQVLRTKLEWLEQGQAFLEKQSGYMARFQKQEVVDGTLLDPQTISIKCRHQPFSVYLHWEQGDVGREVIYVEGKNNGKMLAHDGGWKARLPTLSLKPEASLAMRDARYPVTDAGLLGLVNIMLETHRHDLAEADYASCQQDEVVVDGRPCAVFTTRYRSPATSPKYRKSVTIMDKEWKIPIDTKHYEWPKAGREGSEQEMDEKTLIESYQFDEITFDYHPTAADFARDNPEYAFR